jgi:hypothetical protein
MLLAASCLPRRGHAAHGLDRRLPRGRAALPGPGGGLQRAGHQVTLATHRPIEPDARRPGLGFTPTEGNPRQVLETEQGRAWLEAGRHPLRGTRRLLAVARPLTARLLADATAACQDAETIVDAPLRFAGAHIAERNRVPAVLASLLPLSPTRAFPAPGAPAWRLGGAYNPAQPPGRREVRLAAVPRADQPVAAPHPGAAARAAAWTRPRSAAPTSTGPQHRDRLHRPGQEALRRQAPGQGGCSGRRPSGSLRPYAGPNGVVMDGTAWLALAHR